MPGSDARLLATSLLLSTAVLTLAELDRAGELPDVPQYLGVGVAFMILSAVNDLGAPEVASGFALLILVTVMLTRGDRALRYLGRATRSRELPARFRGRRRRTPPATSLDSRPTLT